MIQHFIYTFGKKLSHFALKLNYAQLIDSAIMRNVHGFCNLLVGLHSNGILVLV